jgi:hypothetical protein
VSEMYTKPREFEVLLPIGYRDPDGLLHRQAVLRKMSGYEEELFYDARLTASQLVTTLLHSCLVRLGVVQPVTPQVVGQLYCADRNYLLLELRRITLGNKMRVVYQCPDCGSRLSGFEDLNQVEVHWLEEGEMLEDIKLELPDGYQDREGTLHKELILTLPRGVDEEFIGPMIKKEPLKARDALILRCIRRFGTLPSAALEAYGVKILRELTLGDRLLLNKSINEHTPGVNFLRQLNCNQCSGCFEAVMDVTSFFTLG